MEVGSQFHALAALPPQERVPSTLGGGRVSKTAGPRAMEKRKLQLGYTDFAFQ